MMPHSRHSKVILVTGSTLRRVVWLRQESLEIALLLPWRSSELLTAGMEDDLA
jgi:hypothetical protein